MISKEYSFETMMCDLVLGGLVQDKGSGFVFSGILVDIGFYLL
jgi:hypothetical protein